MKILNLEHIKQVLPELDLIPEIERRFEEFPCIFFSQHIDQNCCYFYLMLSGQCIITNVNFNSFLNREFLFSSNESIDPDRLDCSNVSVPNVIWHELHTSTCFVFPTYTSENCKQSGDALRKVILAYS